MREPNEATRYRSLVARVCVARQTRHEVRDQGAVQQDAQAERHGDFEGVRRLGRHLLSHPGAVWSVLVSG